MSSMKSQCNFLKRSCCQKKEKRYWNISRWDMKKARGRIEKVRLYHEAVGRQRLLPSSHLFGWIDKPLHEKHWNSKHNGDPKYLNYSQNNIDGYMHARRRKVRQSSLISLDWEYLSSALRDRAEDSDLHQIFSDAKRDCRWIVSLTTKTSEDCQWNVSSKQTFSTFLIESFSFPECFPRGVLSISQT